MTNPVLEQQQQQYHQPRLQIRQLCRLLKERIAKKRWEFQHTEFDPLKLWKVANEVEALNWVLQKVRSQNGVERISSSEDMLERMMMIQLKEELLRIERYLGRPSKANFEFSKRDRLKSRASAIEWSLFQMHFLLAETLPQKDDSH